MHAACAFSRSHAKFASNAGRTLKFSSWSCVSRFAGRRDPLAPDECHVRIVGEFLPRLQDDRRTIIDEVAEVLEEQIAAAPRTIVTPTRCGIPSTENSACPGLSVQPARRQAPGRSSDARRYRFCRSTAWSRQPTDRRCRRRMADGRNGCARESLETGNECESASHAGWQVLVEVVRPLPAIYRSCRPACRSMLAAIDSKR